MPDRVQQTDVKVKIVDPTVGSYRPRIPTSAWAVHKTLLETLHGEGKTRAEMLTHLGHFHDFHPSLNQLTAKMSEWGLRVYAKAIVHDSKDQNPLNSSKPDHLNSQSHVVPPDPVQPGVDKMSENLRPSIDTVAEANLGNTLLLPGSPTSGNEVVSTLLESEIHVYASPHQTDGVDLKMEDNHRSAEATNESTIAENHQLGDNYMRQMDDQSDSKLLLTLQADIRFVYSPLQMSQQSINVRRAIWTNTITLRRRSANVNYVAKVLHSIRLYEIAFHLFYDVLVSLTSRAKATEDLFSLLIQCARSAASREQCEAITQILDSTLECIENHSKLKGRDESGSALTLNSREVRLRDHMRSLRDHLMKSLVTPDESHMVDQSLGITYLMLYEDGEIQGARPADSDHTQVEPLQHLLDCPKVYQIFELLLECCKGSGNYYVISSEGHTNLHHALAAEYITRWYREKSRLRRSVTNAALLCSCGFFKKEEHFEGMLAAFAFWIGSKVDSRLNSALYRMKIAYTVRKMASVLCSELTTAVILDKFPCDIWHDFLPFFLGSFHMNIQKRQDDVSDWRTIPKWLTHLIVKRTQLDTRDRLIVMKPPHPKIPDGLRKSQVRFDGDMSLRPELGAELMEAPLSPASVTDSESQCSKASHYSLRKLAKSIKERQLAVTSGSSVCSGWSVETRESWKLIPLLGLKEDEMALD